MANRVDILSDRAAKGECTREFIFPFIGTR